MTINDASFRDWLISRFDPSDLSDLARYGAAQGFPGLTYYRETTALYEAFKQEIWSLLGETAEAMDQSVLTFLAGMTDGNINTDEQFRNLLVWAAAELIAQEASGDE